jgi:cell filamentation protein
MSRIRWRWDEKDFGFRFKSGLGRNTAECYQASKNGEFYVVPPNQRKLDKTRMEELAATAVVPTAPKVVPIPWRDYPRDFDWVETEDGICINYAGCLHWDEIHRREDEGVARALDLIATLLETDEPMPIRAQLIRQVHKALLGDIYPFAGEWRTVSLHKGEGPTKWPLPPGGIQPVVDIFERDVLSRTPFLSNHEDAVFMFVSELLNELLAIHPFREGNGRTAFIVGNLVLMQNDLIPLSLFDQRRQGERYYAACEAGRLHKDYEPLAALVAEWEAEAQVLWEDQNG